MKFIGLAFAMLFATTGLPASAQPDRAQSPIVLAQKGNRSACCQAQYRQCSAACERAESVRRCWADCDGRLSTCNGSGMFSWRTRPTVHC